MFKVKLDIVREHELHLGDAIIRSKALAETVRQTYPSVVTEIEWKYLPDKSGIQGFAEGRWFDAIMIVTGKLARFTLQVRCKCVASRILFFLHVVSSTAQCASAAVEIEPRNVSSSTV